MGGPELPSVHCVACQSVAALRIVIVTPRFWPLVGGAAKDMANLAGEFVSQGGHVTVLTAQWDVKWPTSVQYRGARVVRLSAAPQSGWSMFRWLRLLRRWLRQHHSEYDLVLVSGLKHEAAAAVRAIGSHKPVVLRAEKAGTDGDCVWQERSWTGRRIQRNCRTAPAVVCPSQLIETELLAAGYDRARIRYVPPGVPILQAGGPNRQAEAREALSAVNAAFHVPPGVPLAVYVGRLERSRDLGTLLAAWASLGRTWPRSRLWLVGAGTSQLLLRDQIDSLGISGRVLLAGVFDDVADVLCAADIALLPTREGGSPTAMLEAMEACLPLVAADVPCYRELATEGVEALFAPPEDHVSWARQIDRLLSDRKLARRLGEAARAKAARGFSLDRMIEEHMRLFGELTLR